MKIKFILLLTVIVTFDPQTSYGQVQMNFKFDTPYGNNPNTEKYAEINGIQMYYVEYG